MRGKERDREIEMNWEREKERKSIKKILIPTLDEIYFIGWLGGRFRVNLRTDQNSRNPL